MLIFVMSHHPESRRIGLGIQCLGQSFVNECAGDHLPNFRDGLPAFLFYQRTDQRLWVFLDMGSDFFESRVDVDACPRDRRAVFPDIVAGTGKQDPVAAYRRLEAPSGRPIYGDAGLALQRSDFGCGDVHKVVGGVERLGISGFRIDAFNPASHRFFSGDVALVLKNFERCPDGVPANAILFSQLMFGRQQASDHITAIGNFLDKAICDLQIPRNACGGPVGEPVGGPIGKSGWNWHGQKRTAMINRQDAVSGTKDNIVSAVHRIKNAKR